MEAKAGQMHTCIIHKQQENAKEILCMRHSRESIEQEPSLIEVIHMTQLTHNKRTHLREANLTGETHKVPTLIYVLVQSDIVPM